METFFRVEVVAVDVEVAEVAVVWLSGEDMKSGQSGLLLLARNCLTASRVSGEVKIWSLAATLLPPSISLLHCVHQFSQHSFIQSITTSNSMIVTSSTSLLLQIQQLFPAQLCLLILVLREVSLWKKQFTCV